MNKVKKDMKTLKIPSKSIDIRSDRAGELDYRNKIQEKRNLVQIRKPSSS